MHPADRIQAAIEATGSIAVVGLDPRPTLIPPALRAEAARRWGETRLAVAWAFAEFNRRLLAAVHGACCAVKLQLACYEAYGAPGLQALEDSVTEARRLGIPVILDGKRGDIGDSAQLYAEAWLGAPAGFAGPLPAGASGDWLTVHPWLGSETLAPFCAHGGIFVLVKTSNPGSGELQDRALAEGGSVAEAVARLVHRLGEGRRGACGLSSVGAVVGATWPEQARRLRALLPDALFLVPGYGAQGASAEAALAGLRRDGRGCIVNSSRAIIGAWQHAASSDWTAAARAALEAMNEELRRARG
ncbi:MAG: orotidine-5'-phosphate decarboxylase [Planctomycetota bacterium]|nr:orotidine-5'-phosphate decarboxylase [Planctomycetota bacterium]MCX8040614.1 orotidine-5'-phosphate decarboxylase [Planctomycetota bacterium]MDW8373766.1 orotidine-5'-phosphate decarboxylase [Planctomycetota bacterium]